MAGLRAIVDELAARKILGFFFFFFTLVDLRFLGLREAMRKINPNFWLCSIVLVSYLVLSRGQRRRRERRWDVASRFWQRPNEKEALAFLRREDG